MVDAAKLHILDTLGCGLAAHATGVAGEGRATMDELGGEPHATVIGSPRRLPAANAAFANAMLCHGLDYDDTHSDSVSHVSTVIAPAALAAAEALGSSGRDVLAASIAGNEVVCRIGMAAPGEFHRRGFHPTAICGVFGGVAAVGELTGLEAEATTRALGIAGSFASGLFAYLADGTPTKPMHPAWAAHGAHLAARLAHHGAAGPQSVLEGKFGLYHAFLGAEQGAVDIAAQLADLGSRWETPRIAFKPYPVCHFMHGSLGSAAEATAGRTFTPAEIDDVLVRVPAAGVSLVLEPAEQKRVPRSEYEGKFSLQYSVASQLVRGHVSVGDFTDEAISRPGGARRRRQGALRDAGVRRPTRRPSPAASSSGSPTGRARGRLPVPEGRPREPALSRRGAREVPRERVARPSRCRCGRARRGRPLARGAGRPDGRPRAAPAARDRPRVSALGLTAEQREIVAAVRDFVDRDVIPVASELEHRDEYPEKLVATMRELGLFGTTIPEEYGGLGLGLDTYALIVIELSRGWMTLSGILNGSFIAATMIRLHGTDGQRERYLPRLASGELRSSFSMTEPHAGSDVQSIRTLAVRDGDDYVITGQKMWVTNGWRSGLVMLLAKTDPDADPPHRGMTGFLVEKEPETSPPGLEIPMPGLGKLGYKGVESTELVFDGFRTPAESVLGGEEGVGRGFKYFMSGIEVGRVNVAARGVGLAQAALDDALRYAQEREAFGKPIAGHQAVQQMIAKMATRAEAARLLTVQAAQRKATGERADLEAGMAKYFATEAAQENALDCMRIHGGYGYSVEYRPERYYRDAPLLLIGEGSNEIQQLIIARRLLERHAI